MPEKRFKRMMKKKKIDKGPNCYTIYKPWNISSCCKIDVFADPWPIDP